MKSNELLIFFSLLVIISYLMEYIAKKTKISSVFMLLSLGIGLQYFTKEFDLKALPINQVLPLLGTLGLILIVLEGALELNFSLERRKSVFKIIGISAIITLTTLCIISLIFYYYFDGTIQESVLNAVPFSVISSAIAIPTAVNFSEFRREFVVYESSISDVLGILVLNLAMQPDFPGLNTGLFLMYEIILIAGISITLCFLLLYLLENINSHVKFFLIISIIVLAYGFAKKLHLSALILVLIFGLFINNTKIFIPAKLLNIFKTDRLSKELNLFKSIASESSFIIRTFFFVFFGYSIKLTDFSNFHNIKIAGILVLVIFSIRLVGFLLLNRRLTYPIFLIGPRGLINILLFLSIPFSLKLKSLNDSVLVMVIVMSIIILVFGGFAPKNEVKQI